MKKNEIIIEVNRIYKDAVKQFKCEYKKELSNYKRGQRERARLKKERSNFIYTHMILIVLILCFSSIVFALLSDKSKYFVICFIVSEIACVIITCLYIKKIDKESTDEIQKMRYDIWKNAIKQNAKNGGYSLERYSIYLLQYHKSAFLHRIIVAMLSVSYTVFTVYLLKDLTINGPFSLVIASIVNISVNFIGNILITQYSLDYYFESLKNDFLLKL